MQLIDRMTARQQRLEKALASQLAWREELLNRLTATDARIAKHRDELRHVTGIIDGLRYEPDQKVNGPEDSVSQS